MPMDPHNAWVSTTLDTLPTCSTAAPLMYNPVGNWFDNPPISCGLPAPPAPSFALPEPMVPNLAPPPIDYMPYVPDNLWERIGNGARYADDH